MNISQSIFYQQNLPLSLPEGFKYNCPHRYMGQQFTVALDWLQLNCSWDFPEALIISNSHKGYIETDCYTLQIDDGDKHFKYHLKVMDKETEIGIFQAVPRNTKKHEQQTTLLKLANHVLYKDWFAVLENLRRHFKFHINKISRIDIAVDGLNVADMLNDELKEKNHNYKRIGKSVIRAHSYNRTQRIFEGWTIGTPKGDKMISIYNKSKDVQRTNKSYIEDFWKANGLNVNETINRFEMRLKNGFLKRLKSPKGFEDESETANGRMYNDIQKLLKMFSNNNFKLQVIQLALKGFFEWVYCDSKNITRCTRIQFIPGDSPQMTMAKRTYLGLSYKPKMLIHSTVKDTLNGKIKIRLATQIISRNLTEYSLNKWYANRIEKFINLYKQKIPDINQRISKLLKINKL